MTKEERLAKQRERLLEMKEEEKRLHEEGFCLIAGVDEVGRGPLAGPVVAAAVILPEDFDVLGVDDSKKLTEKKREELFPLIKENCIAWGVGMADNEIIDDINILQATKLAMKRAINDLCTRLGEAGENGKSEETGAAAEAAETEEIGEGEAAAENAPGPDIVLFDAVEIEDLGIPQKAYIKGDANVLCIAAASVIAKVTRDRMMAAYAGQYPGYAFEKNKGYGTKAHYEGIRENGICPIHRKTFLKNV